MLLKKKYLLYGLAACLLGLWLCGFFFFAYGINHYKPDNTHTDAIVVLTGGRNRIAEAISLLNGGLADKLFISGVAKAANITEIENKAGVRLLLPEKVELGYKAQNTVGNASEVKEWIEKNQIKSVRLVTSNYHLPRSMAELSAYHLSLKVIPHPVYSEKISQKWWCNWGTLKFIFAEYNKYVYVCLRNLIKTGRK
ncbi:MAG: YdcF family protein [Alphaproteobacteria bacterium]|nr:YdcF family protein [Alphaproteobacteria bacterium]